MRRFRERVGGVEFDAQSLQDFEYDVCEPLCKSAKKAGMGARQLKLACNDAYEKLTGSLGGKLYNISESTQKHRFQEEDGSFDFSECNGDADEMRDTFAGYFNDSANDFFINIDSQDCSQLGKALVRAADKSMKESRKRRLDIVLAESWNRKTR